MPLNEINDQMQHGIRYGAVRVILPIRLAIQCSVAYLYDTTTEI